MVHFDHQLIKCLTTLIILTLSFATFAEVTSPSQKSAIEQQQKERLENTIKARNSIKNLSPNPVIDLPEKQKDQKCFQIDNLEFSGNKQFNEKQLIKLTQFEPACIGLNTINQYLSTITNHYVQQGYVTSRAFLVPQNLSSGTLQLLVLEGKIENVLFNGKSQDFTNNAFPNIVNKILNLREIEQGLDQINRLERYNAQIKMLPGKAPGFTIVDIQTVSSTFLTIGAQFNNDGQKNTGEEQLRFNLALENVFDALDKWHFSATKSSAFATQYDSENLNLSIDIPRGDWNLSYRTSYSTYLTTIDNSGFKFDSTGKTNSHNINVKRLFYRDGNSKLTGIFGITHRREKNYILGTLLNSGSRNLSSSTLSLEYSTRLTGGFLSISPSFTTGIDWFGSEKDNNKNNQDPKAQFDKTTLTASYSYPVNNALTASSTFFGQWSDDELYGDQRMSIGGQYSVRGYKGVSISGDRGYYWRNNLNYLLGSLPFLGVIKGSIAFDTGSIDKDNKNHYEQGSMTGTSIGFNTYNSYLSNSLTFGFPVSAPSWIKHDDYTVYYNVNIHY